MSNSNTNIFTRKIHNFDRELYDNVIKQIFPNLNSVESELLLKYYMRILDMIAIFFRIIIENKSQQFANKLRFNNYQDAKGILYLLLPYINSDSDKRNIRSFNDIYISKKTHGDINITEPKYIYSNLQYGRCIRGDVIREINFDISHLEDNFYLLIDTLKIVSKKLYVNWLNVIPISHDEYLEGKEALNKYVIYLKKYIELNPDRKLNIEYTFLDVKIDIEDTEYTNDDVILMSGHTLGDIYDVLTNFLYYEIKKVKWLIYDLDDDDYIIPISAYLKTLFGEIIDRSANDEVWYELDDEIKNDFEIKWNNFLNNNKIKHKNKVIRSIVIFYNNYYRSDDDTIYEDDEEEDLFKLPYLDIIRNARKIRISNLYNFFRQSFRTINNTFYRILISLRRAGETIIHSIDEFKDKIHIRDLDMSGWTLYGTGKSMPSVKNIYNFCKSLCHITINNEYRELPRYWKSLSKDKKWLIMERITNNEIVMEWFNISNNIRNSYGNNYGISTNRINEEIYKVMIDNIGNFVYMALYNKGLLSRLDLRTISNKNILNNTRRIFRNPDMANSIYYLTNKRYKESKTYIEDRVVNYVNYLKSKDGVWYNAYALDWISQINFFHKYLNNRIIYVTGSTGVGKSTQIPKLLLYSMKAIDYNEHGRMVCTQPRTTPTRKNAERIAIELGVPIKRIDNEKQNNYIQYKFRGSNVQVKDINNLLLRMETDGTFSAEIRNMLLKKTIQDNNNNTIYLPENVYDIVAIDEAHEHNANMDIILSLMKNIVNYNNTIKLVIISATMDDDEPNYRRYFRDINDNRMYPLNYRLIEDKYDRINVDRRLHISPPEQTTRYHINEIYVEDSEIIDIVRKIIKNDPRGGDILIFQPGMNEIMKLIKLLNNDKHIPSNTIALPYFSQLPNEQKTIIENIDSYKHLVKINKKQEFHMVDPTIGTNEYNRVIIVATNIAEASITISSLKYVIETGTQKTRIYDYKNKNSVLKEVNISESSRLQRKGRVGRTSPGTVYYMYEEGKMENNKIQYNISIQELSSDLYRRLYNSSNENILFSKHNDPNNPNNKMTVDELPKLYDNNIELIIKKQYFILDEYFDYYGNMDQYDYQNYEPLSIYYESGFSIETLTDSYGKFYIIHPEELNIKRNIIGTITGLTDDANRLDIIYLDHKIISRKIESFWNTLFERFYLDENSGIIYKTKIGREYQILQELLEFDDFNHFISYMYARAYNIEESMIRFISFSRTIGIFTGNFITTTRINNQYIRHIKEVKNIIGSSQSDIVSSLMILDKIHQAINIDNDIYNPDNLRKINLYHYYLNNSDIKESIDNLDVDITSYDIYDELNKGKISSNIYKIEISKYKDIIKKICDELYIKEETIIKYIRDYLQIKNIIYNVNNKLYDTRRYRVDINKTISEIRSKYIDKTLTNKYDKFSTSLLMGYSYNIVKNIRNTNSYISISFPSINSVYNIEYVGRSSIMDTLVDNKYLVGYLIYVISNTETNTISLVHYINPKLLKTINNIYNIKRIKKVYNDYKVKKIDVENLKNVNPYIINKLVNTINEIEQDIMYYEQ